MTGVYKITNPLGQIYIGSSRDVINRFRQHSQKCNYSKNRTKLHKSFLEFGSIGHYLEVLEICTEDQLKIKEGNWQRIYKAMFNTDLNINKAGYCVYKNGKRQRPEMSKPTYFLDTYTGVFYYGTKEISELYNIKNDTIRSYITGRRKSPEQYVRFMAV